MSSQEKYGDSWKFPDCTGDTHRNGVTVDIVNEPVNVMEEKSEAHPSKPRRHHEGQAPRVK